MTGDILDQCPTDIYGYDVCEMGWEMQSTSHD